MARVGRADRTGRQIRGLFKQTKVLSMSTGTLKTITEIQLVGRREKGGHQRHLRDDIGREMQWHLPLCRGLLHQDAEKEDVALTIRLDRASRSDLERLQSLKIAGRNGHLVGWENWSRYKAGRG